LVEMMSFLGELMRTANGKSRSLRDDNQKEKAKATATVEVDFQGNRDA